jgi:excisionase family DNA binding protein
MDTTDRASIADFIGQLRKLLTANELGEYLRISPKTVFRWSKQGRIPVIRMESALRFDPKAIATWLRTRTPLYNRATVFLHATVFRGIGRKYRNFTHGTHRSSHSKAVHSFAYN